VTYGASGSNTTSLAATSDALDLGGLFSSFTVDATLGLSVSSMTGTTLSTGSEGFQVLQGCAKAAGSCSGSDWVDITGHGTSLGGTSFTQTIKPTQTTSADTGNVLVTLGSAIESLRLKWDSSTIAPPASIGVTGTLSVTAVPEPATWALLLAGTAVVAGVARRRLS
jgi:hypothetical protein